MGLCQFSSDYDWLVPNHLLQFVKRDSQSMRSLEEHNRMPHLREVLEPLFAGFRPSWRESEEGEGVSRDSRYRQSRQERARPWNRLDTNPNCNCILDELETWIRYGRSPRIRYKGDVLTVEQASDQCPAFRTLVVFVQAGCRGRDRVPREQMSRSARVFGCDDRHFAQHAYCPGRDVFEVADWRGDHEQRAGHQKAPLIVPLTDRDYRPAELPE